jgi:hypothetical protein
MSARFSGPRGPVRRTVRARTSLKNAPACETLESRCLMTGGPVPGVTVTPTTGLFTTGYGESATFSVVLNTAPQAPVTIPVSSSNTNEGTVYPSTLTFTPEDWSLPKLVSVTGVDDGKADGNVPYTVNLSPATSADQTYSGIHSSSVSMTNKNFEVAGVQVWPSTNLMVTAGSTATFEVELTTAPTGPVIVPIVTTNPRVARASTTAIVFTPSNWRNPQTITVTGQPLAPNASNTAFAIALGSTLSGDPKFSRIGSTSVTGTNVVSRSAFEATAAATANTFMQNEMMNGDMGAMPVNAGPPTAGVGDGADMMTEMMAAQNLVPFMNVTNTAIADGNWSDPNTWMNRQVPAAGANVWIMPNVTVTVDQVFTTPINTIRVTGTLRFNPHVNTKIRVDTIVVDPEGTYMMGSQAEPIDANKTALVSFTDSGPINTTWDPLSLGRGLVSLGTAMIQGAATTAYEPVATLPHQGDTHLTFATAPTNWHVGDSLIMGGDSGVYYHEDDFTIAAISSDGKTVTLNHAVDYNYSGYSQSDQVLYVADMTRNVIFKSENTTSDPEQNGHVMFMHSPNVTVRYADFLGLGRTAGGPDIMGVFAPTISGNDQRGRYAVHLHMDGDSVNAPPQIVQGCVVDGSPGWGYDNHGSHAIITDDIAHNVANAGFVTEDGDETGVFSRDFAIGGQGFGFWLHGDATPVTDCIATGFDTNFFSGFAVWGVTTLGLDGNLHYFAVANQQNPNVVDPFAPAGYMHSEYITFYFARDQSYGNAVGLDIRGTHGALDPVRQDTIIGCSLWDNYVGLQSDYADTYQVFNTHIYSDKLDYVGIHEDAAPANMVYDNLTIVGFAEGIDVPFRSSTLIYDTFLNNVINIRIPFGMAGNADWGTHFVNIQGVTFGNMNTIPNLPAGHTQTNITLDYSDAAGFTDTAAWMLFAPNKIIYNNQELYFPEQAANYVVTGTGIPGVDNKTNAQLWSQYEMAIGGAVAPSSVTTVPLITNALVGPPITVPVMIGPEYAYRLTNWRPAFYLPPVNLNPGWNLVPYPFQGQARTIMIYGPPATTNGPRAIISNTTTSGSTSKTSSGIAASAPSTTVIAVAPPIQNVTTVVVSPPSTPPPSVQPTAGAAPLKPSPVITLATPRGPGRANSTIGTSDDLALALAGTTRRPIDPGTDDSSPLH